MGFFFNEAKESAPKKQKATNRKQIPINSLQAMGCAACPRDADDSLESPKMPPSGLKNAPIYLLGTQPSKEDDREDLHWSDKAGEVVYNKFGKDWMQHDVRSNFIAQCRGDDNGVAAIECCRSRIVADIEECKPVVIVGIGDDVLRWATGISPASTLAHRGTLFAVTIGKHVCWYFPILYPNFAFKKGGRKSEYEVVLETDVRFIKEFVQRKDIPAPTFFDKPYDGGIELITGQEPGDMQRLEAALKKLAKEPESGVDLETNGLRVYMLRSPMLICAAVGTFEHTVAFAIDHPEGWGTDAQRKRVHRLFMDFLLESGTKYAHNLAMEMEWCSFFYGDDVLRVTEWGDTMAMAHCLDERKGSKSLEVQTIRNFGFNLKEQSRVDVRRPNWWLEYPLKEILRYNGMDTKWTDMLRRVYRPVIDENAAYRYEYDRKVRTASTLVIMENLGMPMDMAYAKKMEERLQQELEALEVKIARCDEVRKYQSRYGSFQPTNTEQVLKLMKDVCGRDEVNVRDRDGNKTGESTDEEVLSSIPKAEVPSAALILEHRGLAKLLSTYVDPVTSKKIICVDGLLRSKYSSMVAETGRFNSEDPNIQNWPKRKHKEVRGIIAAPKRQWMMAFDYGQIEFRVVAMASEDKNLVKYCWTGYDVHQYWAGRMIAEYPAIQDRILEDFADAFAAGKKKEGSDFDEDKLILKLLRQDSKNMWVFPQLFGSSVASCAGNLQIPMNVMEDLSSEFWDEFRGAKEWQTSVLRKYEKVGYVETLDGRRRRGAMSPNQIINHPIQGTALSIVCAGMNALSERVHADDMMEFHPRFNGHDDLSFFIDDSRVEKAIPIITHEMVKPRFDFINVPLVVEVSAGPRWNELEEIAKVWSHKEFNIPNPYEESAA